MDSHTPASVRTKFGQAALYVGNRVVTGVNHGDAFGKLTDLEKQRPDMLSGFWNPDTMQFCTADLKFYLKSIVFIRHAQTNEDCEDPGLSLYGKTQARKSALIVGSTDLKKVFSSPARRCMETASELSSEFVVLENLADRGSEESLNMFVSRMHQVLGHIPQEAVIVSHRYLIGFLVEMLVENMPEELSLPNSSVTFVDQRTYKGTTHV